MAPEVTSADRERYARARARGEARAQEDSALVDARYDANRDRFELTFRGGGGMVIPRRMISGLERRPAARLAAVRVSPAGDALRWRSLDVDVYLPGLVERAFGTRLFAAATGRRGGQGDRKPRRRLQGLTVRRVAARESGLLRPDATLGIPFTPASTPQDAELS